MALAPRTVPVCLSTSQPVHAACIRCQESGWPPTESLGSFRLDAHSHHGLSCSEAVHRIPERLPRTTRPSRPPWTAPPQSSGWPFRSFNAQKPCGIGLNSCVFLLTLCVPSQRSLFSIHVRRSHRRKRNFWQHSPNTKRMSTSSSHSTTETRNYWVSINSTST